jgi:hypothetical protein
LEREREYSCLLLTTLNSRFDLGMVAWVRLPKQLEGSSYYLEGAAARGRRRLRALKKEEAAAAVDNSKEVHKRTRRRSSNAGTKTC